MSVHHFQNFQYFEKMEDYYALEEVLLLLVGAYSFVTEPFAAALGLLGLLVVVLPVPYVQLLAAAVGSSKHSLGGPEQCKS